MVGFEFYGLKKGTTTTKPTQQIEIMTRFKSTKQLQKEAKEQHSGFQSYALGLPYAIVKKVRQKEQHSGFQRGPPP